MAGLIEQWRPIKGLEGLYEVSNFGCVRSIDRTIVQMSSHGRPMSRKLKGKMIRHLDNGHGYRAVYLTVDGRRRILYVHRLVAEAFIEKPEGLDVVDHIDNNKSNNRADNLRWCTQLQNVRWATNLMSYPIRKPKSNTGEPFISFREKNGRKSAGYYLSIQSKHIYRRFNTIEEAVAKRRESIGW